MNNKEKIKMFDTIMNNEDVCFILAESHHTPTEILQILANDRRWLVRLGVAQNSNTPKNLLRQLEHDNIKNVREAAIQNPSLI